MSFVKSFTRKTTRGVTIVKSFNRASTRATAKKLKRIFNEVHPISTAAHGRQVLRANSAFRASVQTKAEIRKTARRRMTIKSSYHPSKY